MFLSHFNVAVVERKSFAMACVTVFTRVTVPRNIIVNLTSSAANQITSTKIKGNYLIFCKSVRLIIPVTTDGVDENIIKKLLISNFLFLAQLSMLHF